MDYTIYFESLEMEFDELLETCTNEMDLAFAKVNSVFFEDGEQEQQGGGSKGIIAFIKSCIQSLINYVKGIHNKIKEAIGSAKVDKSKENEKIEFKDIGKENKIVRAIQKDAGKMLKDAKDGKLSLDKVKSYIKNNEELIGNVGISVVTAGGILASLSGYSDHLKSWENELDNIVAENFNDTVNDSVTKMTRMSSSSNRDEEKRRVVNLLLNHYKAINASASKSVLDGIKMLYAKNYLTNRLEHEYKIRTDAKYAKEANKKEKQKMKEADKAADKLVRNKAYQDAAEKSRKEQIRTQAASKNRLIGTKRDMYDDYDADDVDVDTKGRASNYTVMDTLGNLGRRAKGRVGADVKNLKSRMGLN